MWWDNFGSGVRSDGEYGGMMLDQGVRSDGEYGGIMLDHGSGEVEERSPGYYTV